MPRKNSLFGNARLATGYMPADGTPDRDLVSWMRKLRLGPLVPMDDGSERFSVRREDGTIVGSIWLEGKRWAYHLDYSGSGARTVNEALEGISRLGADEPRHEEAHPPG